MFFKFKPQLTTTGFLSIIEFFVRIHPLLYLFARNLVKFLSIFEIDFVGVKLINFGNKKINFIDVGASDGIAVNSFKNLIKNYGKAYCFEPNDKFAQILKKNKNVFKVFKYGLSDRENDNYVYIPCYKFFNKSFFIPTYTTNKYIEAKKFIKKDFYFNKNISILKRKIKLKKYTSSSNIKEIHFIKIDVNGFELNVLKTLFQIIKQYKPALYLEVTFKKKEIIQYLSNLNYKKYYYCSMEKKLKEGSSKKIVNYFFLQKKHLIGKSN
jgi:FkbM family methyltransferase